MPADGRAPAAGSVAIVGAGISGLAAAAELAPHGRVTVIDRLPAVGGVLGFERGPVRELERESAALGADLVLGTTVSRWTGDRLLLAGPDGIRWLAAETLVYAGGTRPATLAEGRVAGGRLAGVLPAPVAEHLLEAEVLLGHRVVVAGDGHWARVVLARLAHHPCRVTLVAEDAALVASGDGDVATIAGWRLHAVGGRDRISEAILERDGRRMSLACDALVLAGGERPLRNVDGAVSDPAPGVVYIQPHGPAMETAAVAELARRAARAIHQRDQGVRPTPGGVP